MSERKPGYYCIWCGEWAEKPPANIADFLHLYVYGKEGEAVSDMRLNQIAGELEALKQAP